MTKLIDLPDALKLRRQFGIFDEFDTYVSTERWTTTTDAGGTASVSGAGVGGILAVVTDADDNDETYVETTAELFKFAADKPLLFEARVQFAEAATDAANILIGLMDAPGADSLVDNGSGPKASYSGAVLFKVDSGTVWQAESSIGSSQTTTLLDASGSLDGSAKTAGGATYQTLRIEFQPITSTDGEVRFFIDETLVVKHSLTFTSATEMAIVLGAKAGSATAETLNIDYVGCHQLR